MSSESRAQVILLGRDRDSRRSNCGTHPLCAMGSKNMGCGTGLGSEIITIERHLG
jgi:hypothetical protein